MTSSSNSTSSGLSLRVILLGVLGLALLIALGWTGLWYAGKGEAKQQVAKALASLSRAGANSTYDDIEISGFPFGYRAAVGKLQIENPANRISLPKVSAEVTLDDADTVTFALPARFEVLNKISGMLFVIESDAMSADVTPGEDNAYDMSLRANRLKVSSDTKTAPGPLELKDFLSKGEFVAREGEARLQLAVSASDAVQKFRFEEGDGEAVTGEVKAERLDVSVNGAIDALGARFSADKVLLAFDQGGVIEILKPHHAVTAKPKDRFDPAPLQSASDFGAALAAFGQMATKGVAEGGEAKAEFKFASLKGSGSLEGRRNSADIEDFALSAAFGAQEVGLELQAKKTLIDLKLPDESDYYLAADEQFTSIKATPSDAFDFSIIGSARAVDLASQAVLAELYTKVAQGGSLEMTGRSGPSVSRNTEEGGFTPFKRIESRSEGGTSRIAVTPEEAVVALDVNSIGYKLSEGMEGEADLDALKLDFYSPLKAAPQPQKAQLRFNLGALNFDEALWSLIDPKAALKREVNGLNLGAEAEMTIRRDVLSPDADIYNLSDPAILPGAVKFSNSYVDLLGVRAEMSGALNVFPLPSGAFEIGLSGWRQFFEAMQNTPMTEDPQLVSSLLMVNDIVVNYGAPVDPAAPEDDAMKFDIRLGGVTGVSINGKPYPK